MKRVTYAVLAGSSFLVACATGSSGLDAGLAGDSGERDAMAADAGRDGGFSGDADAGEPIDAGPEDAGRIPVCGDAWLDPGEQCDDADADDDDGCDRGCRVTGRDEVFLQVRGVPAEATRLFLALDGGGLPEPAVTVEPASGDPIVYVRFAVGSGGPYRIRVLATLGTGFPAALAGGFVAGLIVPGDGAVGGSVELAPVTLRVDAPTPRGARIGAPFEVALTLTDPALALEGRTSARLWSGASPFEDLTGTQDDGTLAAPGAGGERRFLASMTAGNPNVARRLYYQLGEAASDFESRGEVPFLVRPATRAGEPLLEIGLEPSNSGVRIHVDGAPAGADRAYLSIDGGAISGEALRWDVPVSGGAADVSLALPPGIGYRVRAAATAGAGSFPIVLAGGRTEGIAVPGSPIVDVAVSLAAPAGSWEPPTPDAVTLGDAYDVALAIDDPADFLDGVSGGRIWWGTSAEPDLMGTQESGTTSRVGPGAFRFRATMPAPTREGTVLLQFAESSSAFGRPGTIAPFLALPALAAGAARREVIVTAPTSGIALTATSLPPSTRLVIVVVDGVGSARRFEVVPAGASSTASLGLPAASGYRVRAIAIADPVGFPVVLAGAHALGVEVSAGAFVPLALDMLAPGVVLEPETPASAPPSSAVRIVMRVTDPARFLEGLSAARLWSDTAPFSNLSAAQSSGRLSAASPGVWRFEIDVTTPAARGLLYFQLGEAGSGPWGTPVWAPFLVGPDTAAGGALFTLRVE